MMSFISRLLSYIPSTGTDDSSAYPVDEPPTEKLPSLYESLMQGLSSGADHVSALASLFALEVGEAGERARDKAIWLIGAAFALIVGYLFICVTLTILIAGWLGWLYAALILGGFHLIVGGIALVIGLNRKVGPIAPQTLEELQVDYQCLKIAAKESSNS